MDDQDKKDNESQQVPETPKQELPEDLEAAMAWLEQLAARQGAPREELPSIDDDDDLSGEPDSLPDWLKDLPESADTGADFDLDDLDLPIDDSVPEEDLPDWLKVRAATEAIPEAGDSGDSSAAPADELDWLDELTAGSATEELPTMQWEGGPAGREEAATAADFAEEAAAEEDAGELPVGAATAAAAAAMAAAGTDDDAEVEDAMAWLEQMASGEGEPIDDMPTLVSERAATADALEDPAGEPTLEPAAPAGHGPEDMDDAMDWLEQLAADQSTPLEELPSVADRVLASTVMAEAGVQAVNAHRVVLPEHLETAVAHLEARAAAAGISLDDVELEEIEEVDGLEALLAGLDERARSSQGSGAARAAGLAAAGAAAVGMAARARDEEDVDWDELSSEMPEDPDEALAWLERLADEAELSDQDLMTAEADADAVEEPTRPGLQAAVAEDLEGDLAAAAETAGLEDDFLSEMPEDPDEAMAWLEQLAARQGASLDELPSVSEVREEVDMPDWLAAQVAAQQLEGEAAGEEEQAESGRAAAVIAGVAGAAAVGAAVLDADDEGSAAEEAVAGDETDAGLVAAAAVAGAAALGDDAVAEPPEETLAWIDDLGEGDVAELLADEEEAAATAQYDPRVAPQPASEMVTRAEMALEQADAEAAEAFDEDLDARGRALSMLGRGNVDAAADTYQQLIDEGEGLPLVIADLETAVAEHADKPVLNRLLGDAYMRNGQLQKALEAYRQALDHL